MEKFILTKTGEEVKIGDILVYKFQSEDKQVSVTKTVMVTPETIPHLLKSGIIEEGDLKDFLTYFNKVRERLDTVSTEEGKYLMKLADTYPYIFLSMILKEIAIDLDKKYPDHIQCSPEIYVISLLDGRITKANKAHIKNYRNFAAFRSIEDARIACKIVKPLLKDLFGKNK